MKASAKQIEMGGLESDVEEQLEIEAGYLWREALWSAMRSFVAGYIANGQKGYDAVASALDRRWAPKGRPVAASALRSALHDVERNNFRAEWLDWFAARSPEVADLLAKRVKPEKNDRQMLEDLVAELREDMSEKRIVAAMRRARTR